MKWQEIKQRAKIALHRFMYGRYGVDQLTVVILISSVVALFLASIFRIPLLQLVYYAGVLWAFYRILSKDLAKRRKENQMLLQLKNKVDSWVRVQQRIFAERDTHRHFKCPRCKQRLRVPKGRGKITVNCSKCGEKFSRKS